jgi:hypothetical protein
MKRIVALMLVLGALAAATPAAALSYAYPYYTMPYSYDYYGMYGSYYQPTYYQPVAYQPAYSYYQPSYSYYQPYQYYGSAYGYGGYGYSAPSPYNRSSPTGDRDLWGHDLCYWEGYDGRARCDFNPRQPVYDPYTGTWY